MSWNIFIEVENILKDFLTLTAFTFSTHFSALLQEFDGGRWKGTHFIHTLIYVYKYMYAWIFVHLYLYFHAWAYKDNMENNSWQSCVWWVRTLNGTADAAVAAKTPDGTYDGEVDGGDSDSC